MTKYVMRYLLFKVNNTTEFIEQMFTY